MQDRSDAETARRIDAAIQARGADEVALAVWSCGNERLAIDLLDRFYPLPGSALSEEEIGLVAQ